MKRRKTKLPTATFMFASKRELLRFNEAFGRIESLAAELLAAKNELLDTIQLLTQPKQERRSRATPKVLPIDQAQA